jgi:CRISPR-associated helicase Cas3/CRISPR-associated endonuclease Cas3-HD
MILETEYLARPGQTVKEHSNNVSRLAARFASAFGAEKEGALVGLCHDFGKYSQEFQERLAGRGGPGKPDHATAGARELAKHYGEYGKMLAYASIGHHSGLPDTGSEASGFTQRMKKPIPKYDVSEIAIGLDLPPRRFKDMFAFQFFIRMLFSCLVDADRLDAGNNKTDDISLSGFLDKLPVFTNDSDIGRKRNEIRGQCLKAAERPHGLFTLSVPTGGGKTWSSMAFALKHAELHGMKRVIYSIPYTSIIEQTAAEFKKKFGVDFVLEHHSNYAFEDAAGGDDEASDSELHTENWDAPVVVTTNVQFFESLFSNRPGRCRKLHNIANSVIILDEAQMLPVPFLEPCRRAISELAENYGCTVVSMSATQPPHFEKAVEIIEDTTELEKFFSRTKIIKLGRKSDEELLPDLRNEPQVLVIVNTKAHARALCSKLGDGAYCLTANLCPKHRSLVLAEIKDKLALGLSVRVVSTQLIEAGVDIDFPAVYRAACGLDSLAQSAGRCNRERKLPDLGRVYSFESAEENLRGYLSRTAVYGMQSDGLDDYFNRLYRNESTDKHKILGQIDGPEFLFETISNLFRLIDDCGEPAIVPFDDEAKDLLRQLEFAPSKRVLRKLRPYTVNVRDISALPTKSLCGLVNVVDICCYGPKMGIGMDLETEALFV